MFSSLFFMYKEVDPKYKYRKNSFHMSQRTNWKDNIPFQKKSHETGWEAFIKNKELFKSCKGHPCVSEGYWYFLWGFRKLGKYLKRKDFDLRLPRVRHNKGPLECLFLDQSCWELSHQAIWRSSHMKKTHTHG